MIKNHTNNKTSTTAFICEFIYKKFLICDFFIITCTFLKTKRKENYKFTKRKQNWFQKYKLENRSQNNLSSNNGCWFFVSFSCLHVWFTFFIWILISFSFLSIAWCCCTFIIWWSLYIKTKKSIKIPVSYTHLTLPTILLV